ncbi:MAG: hypothetical protein LBG96_03220 [Tannerella sp.]|jgi:hypothetical protein|nr:hypothetical protein [Tannerella sp.]
MKKNEFKEVVAAIQAHIKNGDLPQVSKRCGVSTKTWHAAKKKATWDELTSGETKIVMASIAFLKERNELIEYASENL